MPDRAKRAKVACGRVDGCVRIAPMQCCARIPMHRSTATGTPQAPWIATSHHATHATGTPTQPARIRRRTTPQRRRSPAHRLPVPSRRTSTASSDVAACGGFFSLHRKRWLGILPRSGLRGIVPLRPLLQAALKAGRLREARRHPCRRPPPRAGRGTPLARGKAWPAVAPLTGAPLACALLAASVVPRPALPRRNPPQARQGWPSAPPLHRGPAAPPPPPCSPMQGRRPAAPPRLCSAGNGVGGAADPRLRSGAGCVLQRGPSLRANGGRPARRKRTRGAAEQPGGACTSPLEHAAASPRRYRVVPRGRATPRPVRNANSPRSGLVVGSTRSAGKKVQPRDRAPGLHFFPSTPA